MNEIDRLAPIVVYSFHRCPFAMRVRMTLHEKGLAFEIKEEDLKNLSPELRRLHPEAKVPVLVHGSRVIFQSSIITEYVDELVPASVALMPSGAGPRSEVRLWTYWCDQLFKPSVDRLKYGISRFPESECAGIENRMIAHLDKLERTLSKSEFLVGESFSLADIHVFPFARQLLRITPSPNFVASFPGVLAWADRIGSRLSFLRTMRQV